MSIYHEPFCGGKCLHRHWEKKRWKSLWIKENRWYTCCHFPHFPISKSSLVRWHASLYTFTTIIQCMWRKEKRSITKYILHLLPPLQILYITYHLTRQDAIIFLFTYVCVIFKPSTKLFCWHGIHHYSWTGCLWCDWKKLFGGKRTFFVTALYF